MFTVDVKQQCNNNNNNKQRHLTIKISIALFVRVFVAAFMNKHAAAAIRRKGAVRYVDELFYRIGLPSNIATPLAFFRVFVAVLVASNTAIAAQIRTRWF